MRFFCNLPIKLVLAKAFVTTNAPANITTKGLQNPENAVGTSNTPTTPRIIQHVMVIRPNGHLLATNAAIININTAITIYASIFFPPDYNPATRPADCNGSHS